MPDIWPEVIFYASGRVDVRHPACREHDEFTLEEVMHGWETVRREGQPAQFFYSKGEVLKLLSDLVAVRVTDRIQP